MNFKLFKDVLVTKLKKTFKEKVIFNLKHLLFQRISCIQTTITSKKPSRSDVLHQYQLMEFKIF